MLGDRSNLRHLLQPNNNNSNNSNSVYIQTGPNQYQAIQPHLAQQFQNRFSWATTTRFPSQINNQLRMLLPAQSQNNRMPVHQQNQQQQQQQRPPQYQTNVGVAKWHTPQQNSSGMIILIIIDIYPFIVVFRNVKVNFR